MSVQGCMKCMRNMLPEHNATAPCCQTLPKGAATTHPAATPYCGTLPQHLPQNNDATRCHSLLPPQCPVAKPCQNTLLPQHLAEHPSTTPCNNTKRCETLPT